MLYWLGHFLFTIIFKYCFRWKILGYKNIPERGPLIICSNHISWFDPPLVGCMIRRRKVYFMAKEELFKFFLFGWVLRKIGVFPVKRGLPDRRAIRQALKLLGEGKVVGMFPEGRRSKTGRLQEPLNGVALIALKSRAPILPVAIIGPYRLFQPVKVVIGSLLTFEDFTDRKNKTEVLKQVSHRIMGEIGRLMKTA